VQKIKEEEEKEKETLRLAHETQLERTRAAAEEAIQSLINQHHQKEYAHEEVERQRLQGAENKYWTGVYDAILTHQENYTKLIEKHHKEQIEFLAERHKEELLVFDTERLEIDELCREQGRTDVEKEEFLQVILAVEQQVLLDHSIQTRELKAVHSEDLIALKREQKRYRQEVKKTAPDTILYVYAKKKKEKQEKKKLLESRSKTELTNNSDPDSPGSGPTRSTSAMMLQKKDKKK